MQTSLTSPPAVIAQPFMKWAGGKRQLITQLESYFPEKIQAGKIKKYAEAFIGGGALFFFIAQKYPTIERFFISDINRELILTYKTIQQDADSLISFLQELEHTYLSKDEEERKSFFYQTRNEFNAKLSDIDFNDFQNNWIERAGIIIFLNRTCFNGLFRVNSKGEFNVPFGSYKKPKICDAENLLATSRILQRAEICLGNFSVSKKFIDKDTFVYFDPPYRPISKTASFTSYSKDQFDDEDQKELAEFYAMLHEKKGASLMLSNSETNDSFFDNLYSRFYIQRVNATRRINSNGKNRGKIKELLIMNYKDGANEI